MQRAAVPQHCYTRCDYAALLHTVRLCRSTRVTCYTDTILLTWCDNAAAHAWTNTFLQSNARPLSVPVKSQAYLERDRLVEASRQNTKFSTDNVQSSCTLTDRFMRLGGNFLSKAARLKIFMTSCWSFGQPSNEATMLWTSACCSSPCLQRLKKRKN